ncbi:MAG: beta strand repeat-containing protein, partial [Planctomycetaceae bacterium]
GQVVATYQSPSGGEGPATIFVNTDPDGLGPQPFGAHVTVTTTNVGGFDYIPAQPNRSVDAEAGLAYDFTTSRLYLVYTDEIGAESNNLDIRLRFSDNNGATWSNFVRVNDDLGVNSQFLPRIAVDNAPGSLTQGFVAVSWYDARNDLVGNNDAQFYTTYSNTQGASFAANVRVSSGTSNANNANDGNDYGDYTGLDFWNGAWYPLWADNGNTIGNANAPTLDQATARVILTDPVVQPNLTVTIVPTSIAEGGAGATATITRGGSTAAALVVTLTSSDPTIATIQPTVTIPAGQPSVSVPVNSVVSPLAITRQAAIITATATGFDSQSDVVDVTDATVRALTVTLASGTVAEGAQITGTVRRNTPTTEDLIVTLFVTDSTEAVPTPVTVTILAGDATADFALDGVQDFLADGTRQLAVVAAAPNHDSGRANLSVTNTAASFAASYNLRGDTNTIRDQGQIQIYGNAVSQVSQFGILVDEAQRGGFGPTLPLPGSVISTPTLNSARLLPGVNISNNQVTNFGQGGIRYEGSGSLQPLGSVPFGRIVNNTVYGGATATGVGIGVFDQAGPTIMNNIVANTVTGIQVDAGSAPNTVVDATVFQRNTTNLAGITATNTIALTTAQPLFVAPATGNFYLAPGSLAIDSSRNSLSERASIAAVKSPLAIPVSPIIAPANDRFGQLRVDDPAVPNAIGLGSNIFIDRGAVERADFSKPKGRLITPLDNGAGVDGNPALDTVFITSPAPLTQFVLQLTDVGVGIDHNTVTSAAFVLRKDNVALVNGVDYQFVYNRNTRQVFFQSVSLFAPQSTYTITIPANVVKDLAGNTLQANQTNGSTVFTIIGNAPPSLTQIATFPGLKNIPQVITHAQLLAASDLKVVTGHSAQFRIEAVLGGTLVIRKSGSATAVPVVPGTTIIAAGDTVTWTPPADLVGITGAFTVVGYDPQNAVIAPALAVSDPPVGVTIDLVDRAPTLTAVDPNKLGSATEDTPFSITYATLLAASNATDANNDQIRFQVESVVAGTQLQISIQGAAPVNVLPGVSLLGPGDRLIWTPPLNGNNQINGGNPLAAFTIVAFDGTNESSPPVQVSINVNPVADAPILTEVDTLSLAGLNSQFKITYATLLAASDLQNVDGHTREFRVQSIPTGAALSIRKAATPLITTPVVPGTTVVSPGDVLIWTPPVGVFGDAVPAFDVVGYDSFNAANFPTVVPSVVVSSPPVTVTVQVLGEIAPRLTTINTLVRPRFVPATITYQNLVDNSDLVFQPGNTVGFRIDRIDQGTLLRNGLAAAVGDVVLPGDTLTFNLLSATGVQDAFDVTAVDINNTLTSLDPVQVRVNLINVAPTLTRIDTLSLAEQET